MKPELVSLFGCLFVSVLLLTLPCLGEEIDASAKITAIAAKRLNEGETAKFWVSFTDKGKETEKILQQKAQLLDQEDPWGAIFARFEPRALERRKKVLKERELLDVDDLDVHEKYIEAVVSVKGVSLVSRSRWLNAISVSVDLSQNPSALLDIAALPFVSEIDRVHSYKRKLPNTPIIENQKRDASLSRFSRNEPTDEELAFYGQSYDQLDQINVIALHKRNITGKGVLVLMIDSGFNKNIPSFQKSRLVDEHDFINDDDDVSHQNGDYETQETHGTATTSCVGGYDPGYLIGAAYEVDFLLAKTEITEEEIQVEEDYWVEAIEWGEKKGADLVSSSLGYSLWWHYSDCTGKASKASLAADKASQKGVLVVISAGNDRNENGFISIPGDAEYALTVGAVTSTGDVVYFSSQGPTFDGRIKPDVAALGYHDHVATTDGVYTTMSGTSFAAPLTAGACALLIQAHPDWTPFQIRTAMRMTASINDNPNVDLGWGIINAEAACDFDQEAFQNSSKPLSHGNCTDDNNCECETGFYGSYCLYPLVECASFCTGGLCFGEECTCDTQWEGKRCDLEKFVLVVPGLGSEIVTVVLLCFSILMLLFVLLFFFCIVRP